MVAGSRVTLVRLAGKNHPLEEAPSVTQHVLFKVMNFFRAYTGKLLCWMARKFEMVNMEDCHIQIRLMIRVQICVSESYPISC